MLTEIENILRKSWQDEGHHLTGGFEKSLMAKRARKGVVVMGNDYGLYMNYGVKSSKIPFQRGSGKKTSKYIQGLTRYGQLRKGLSLKEAKSFAFAVATKHKKRGMPLRKPTGTRFIEKSWIPIQDTIYKSLGSEWSKKIDEIYKINFK